MIPSKLANEAEKCRRLAGRYPGRPEQPFLLNAAALFDDLASADPHDQADTKVSHQRRASADSAEDRLSRIHAGLIDDLEQRLATHIEKLEN